MLVQHVMFKETSKCTNVWLYCMTLNSPYKNRNTRNSDITYLLQHSHSHGTQP